MNDDPVSDLREEPRPEFAASLLRRLRELEQENGRLKRMYADLALETPRSKTC